MIQFQIHDKNSAPAASRPVLAQTEKVFGFVPNIIGMFAESPAALKGYTGVAGAFASSSFSAAEQQTVLLETSRENGCEYCMAAHSTVAGMEGVPEDVIRALRDGSPIDDPRLEALRLFTRKVVEGRGRLPNTDVQSFLDAGFTRAQILEVLLGVTQKTLSNYANHIAGTPLDEAFAESAWAVQSV